MCQPEDMLHQSPLIKPCKRFSCTRLSDVLHGRKRYDEHARNGYEILKGKLLKELKIAISGQDVPEVYFENITKSPQLGIFDYRTFLNLAMLMVKSERAKLLRQTILDIVIDTTNQRTGGGTKYINQWDEDFLHSWFEEENYRKQFS